METSENAMRKYQPLKKLTLEQAEDAARRYEAGESLQPIAADYGVTRQAMWDLLRRRIMLRDRLEALPRKAPNAVRRHRDINRKRYRARAARVTRAQEREVRERDQVCRMCWAEGTDIDHILAVALGGQTELANLQLLCHPCHVEKSRTDRRLAAKHRKEVVPMEVLAESILSAEASRDPVKIYRWPDVEPDLAERVVDFGLSLSGSCAKCGHDTSSLKTSRALSVQTPAMISA